MSDALKKLSASLLVLVMALSALVVLPGSGEGQTPGTNTIYVPVVSGGSPVSNGVSVTLTNVHTGEVIPAPYSSAFNLYVAQNAPSGYYRVDVAADDYYDQFGAREFRFEALSAYTVSPQISLLGFEDKIHEWNVTVRAAATGLKITGAKVSFYDLAAREVVSYAYTNTLGYAVVSMFDVPTVGDFALVVEARTYETYLQPYAVTSNNTMTVSLSKSLRLTGFVTVSEGPASNVVAYLLNNDTSVPWIKRLLKSATGGSFFVFDAYPGEYLLCIDALGAKGQMEYVTLTSSSVDKFVELDPQPQRVEQVTIAYGADFNSFTLSMSTTWSFDEAYPGLRYADVGSLRMQIDLNSDTPDGTIDASEVSGFLAKVSGYGAQYVTSARLLAVNETLYRSSLSLGTFSLGLTSGSVVSSDGVSYSYSCAYSSIDALDVGAPDYSATMYPRYDSAATNYTYAVTLPSGYELVYNLSSAPGVLVKGYQSLIVDAPKGTGWSPVVDMSFEASARPSAGAGVEDTATTYVVRDAGGNVTRYIVRIGANATLTANDSDDPNGNPLKFTWDFGDGSAAETTWERIVRHMYTSAGMVTVNLTVEDVAGLVNWTEIEVVRDGRDPVPVLTVKDRQVNETTGAVMLNEREVVWFNATYSYDGAATDTDGLGVIESFVVHYGDGNSSGRILWTDPDKNVSHSYERANEYHVVLNVTDSVGHWKNTTMKVVVNDTTPPTPSFTVKNETWGTTLIENMTLTFDASGTRDNVDNYTLLTYHWNFGDGTPWDNATGWNTTHTYQKIGRFLVTINVTDLSNNSQVYSKWITISQGPRPDVKISDVWFDPEVFTEGRTQQFIMVNLTNAGSAVAENVTVSFYIVGDTDKAIGTTTILWNGTVRVDNIAVGGSAQVKFAWTPGAKGTYTIKVTVTSADQLITHSLTDVVDVNEAGWKKYALWGGVLGVIILVPLLLYLRGHWSKREKKGPRRERKSSE